MKNISVKALLLLVENYSIEELIEMYKVADVIEHTDLIYGHNYSDIKMSQLNPTTFVLTYFTEENRLNNTKMLIKKVFIDSKTKDVKFIQLVNTKSRFEGVKINYNKNWNL